MFNISRKSNPENPIYRNMSKDEVIEYCDKISPLARVRLLVVSGKYFCEELDKFYSDYQRGVSYAN